MTMFYVYIIQSEKDGRLYKGMTQNLENRIREHNRGKTKTTKHFKPWKLLYYEEFPDRIQARAREKYFKSGGGRRFIYKHLKLGSQNK